MFVVTIILAVLLALAYGMAGTQKVIGTKMMVEGADHLGIPRERYRLIGVAELLAAAGLLAGLAVWPLGVAAGIGLVLLMAGAVVYHLRAGDKVQRFGPPLVLGIVALAEVVFRAASA